MQSDLSQKLFLEKFCKMPGFEEAARQLVIIYKFKTFVIGKLTNAFTLIQVMRAFAKFGKCLGHAKAVWIANVIFLQLFLVTNFLEFVQKQ